MLLLILAIITWVGWIVACAITGWDTGEKVLHSLLAFFFGWIPIGLVLLVLIVTLGSALPHQNVYKKFDLASLDDGSSLHGQFFLGSGYVSDTPTYTFYLNTGHGIKLENAGAEHINVFQDSKRPYAKVSVDCHGSWTWLVACNNGFTNTSDGEYTVGEIHLPENTIKQNFVLDTK